METFAPARVARSRAPLHLDDAATITRLGMIALSTDLTSERDAWRYLPTDRAALHVTRVPFDNPSTPENLRKVGARLGEAAALILPDIALAAIAFACTTASVAIGEEAVAEAIGQGRPGVPVVTPSNAAVAGFAALGISRIALVTPYLEETTVPMAAYFSGRGLDVVRAECLGIADDRDMAMVSGETIATAALAADGPDVDAIFVSCTALPTIAHVDRIEALVGKPVLASNQAVIWQMLHLAGLGAPAHAPGRLFQTVPQGA